MPVSFDTLVAQQLERLQTWPLTRLEADSVARRCAWLDDQRRERDRGCALPGLGASPRAAFELLFFEYMRLSPAELPILHESATEIVWSSQNRCPTLEACQTLGLDTKVVCRKAYEKSTQAFLSRIDPRLRFLRDYTQIRPHARGCVERIERVDFEQMMRVAIAEAEQSLREGNKGYGAVVALGQRVLAQAHDTAVTARDSSQHAELRAIRQAGSALSDPDLSGAIVFSTCEPCPMCTGLAVWANVSAIAYGASIAQTAARGKTRILVSASEIVERSPARIELLPGILDSECLRLYSS